MDPNKETNSFPKSTWRLIRQPPLPGAHHMAIDEAILESVDRGEAPPTLRLYSWEPACLSLGFAQPAADIDDAALDQAGWDLVRRPTGGRAILHVDELTYSVIGPEDEPRLSGGVLKSYHNLSLALLHSLHLLNIPAEALETPAGQPSAGALLINNNRNPVCFEVPSNYEITVAGKKLIGSAQARRREGVLQHGSLPLFGDLTRIVNVLQFPDQQARQQAARRLLDRAATVEMVIGRIVPWDAAADVFVHAFSQALDLELVPGSLTEAERRQAAFLVKTKFNSPEWTRRV